MPDHPNVSEHLTLEALARLLEQARQRPEILRSAADLHPHLAVCADCRENIEEILPLESSLRNLRGSSTVPQSESSDCPEPNLWREIVVGIAPHEQTLSALRHASQCGVCSPLLRQALAEVASLHGEITELERQHISELASSHAEWQQDLARRIASEPGRGTTQPIFFRLGSLAGRLTPEWLTKTGIWKRSGAGRSAFSRFALTAIPLAAVPIIAIIVAGAWFWHAHHQPAAAERLLAKAYTQQRTLELRLAGASFAPLRISRGPAASFTSRSQALLRAEALIASQLESNPTDAAWLHAQAQADLLEGRYDAAVEALRTALESDPHSPSLLIDLATAYSQRALQEDRQEDFGAAYEFLSQALRSNPNDAVALFNRAIVADHQFLYHQALDDWDHYLRLDPGSQWADEARNRAEAVRQKLAQHGSKATPLLSPAEIVARLDDASLQELMSAHVEEYLREAVTAWLPRAYPEPRPAARNGDRSHPSAIGTGSDASRALFFLADLTSRQHNDHWLTDLLRRSESPNFASAVAALVRAAAYDATGDYNSSRQQAATARRLFLSAGNIAGALRSEFELVFADQLTRRSEECRRRAAEALPAAKRYSYTWLEIQFGLENAVCAGLMSDFGANARIASLAMAMAEKNGYTVLYLRALGFVAGIDGEIGNPSESWKVLNNGFQRFWSGPYPTMRGYNFYTESARFAEIASQPNLRVASWREATYLVDNESDLLLRAVAHDLTAKAAAVAENSQLAAKEFEIAAKLFSRAPHNEVNRNLDLEAQIRLAQIELRQGHFDQAIAGLTGIQDQIRSLSNDYVVQLFYSTLGQLQLADHHPAEAETSLQPAITLTEQSLASIASPTSRIASASLASPEYMALSEAELVQNHSQESLAVFEWYMGITQRSQNRGHDSNAFSPSLDNPITIAITDPSRLSSRIHSLSAETVIAYAAMPDGIAIWVFDDRGVNAKWLPQSMENLRELADRVHDLSSNPKSTLTALNRDSRALYGALIGPIEPSLAPGRTLVIETDGWLSRVPFEALLDPSGHYLIERAPIVHSLGQDSDAILSSNDNISPDVPSLIAGSTVSPRAEGLLPLPDVGAEVDAVAARFHSPHVLKSDDATLPALENELPSAAVFHFAGHSLSTPDHAGLLLAVPQQPGASAVLDADILSALDMRNLRLAVLSSCGTDSANLGSAGFNTMAEAFLRSGVPHVVASRWTVDSEQARVFVSDFYRGALTGQPVSLAVRHAALAMLSNRLTSHPYYWAAFSAYGRP